MELEGDLPDEDDCSEYDTNDGNLFHSEASTFGNGVAVFDFSAVVEYVIFIIHSATLHSLETLPYANAVSTVLPNANKI